MNPDNHSNKKFEINLADLSGEDLLQLWKDGNERAAGILADRYSLRLVALVAAKLNQRFRGATDPEDIVQSALGSFFNAAAKSRIQVSNSLSLWRLLATFTRRKMSKVIERHDSMKRGGSQQRISFQLAEQNWSQDLADPGQQAIASRELLDAIETELPESLKTVLHGLLAGQTQTDLAQLLAVDERTIRRRIVKLRKLLAADLGVAEKNRTVELPPAHLPRFSYSEFVLGKLIGMGGFGKVYRAALQADGSIVAVKFLRKGFWNNQTARQSFLREIDIASDIQCPGVIKYLGWGLSPHGGPFVISEWIEGQTLTSSQMTTPEIFCDYLRQVCIALDKVHCVGIVHGDLTPNNILIDKSGRITITDFGFSQRRRDAIQVAGSSNAELDLLLGGTVGFAAPEQFSSAFGTIGPRTDIYALGAIAYWYLTGRAPHQADSSEQAIANTISPKPIELASTDSVSPAIFAIRRIATMALEKPILARPDSTIELRDLIRTVQNAGIE